MEPPFISFLSDFGADGAAAICRGVMLSIARDAQIVDISHAVRKFAIRDGAYLLWSSLPWMPVGIHVAIVDPGVGTARRPMGIRTGRGDILIGPDNGLLVPAADRLDGIAEVRLLKNHDWMLPRTSATFHGRDIFAPMAGHLAVGGSFESVGETVDVASLEDLRFPAPLEHDGRLEAAVVYVDSFGNIRLAAGAADLAAAVGIIQPGARLRVVFEAVDGAATNVTTAAWARTFGTQPVGASLVYEDSSGQLAFGDNQGDAAARLGVASGSIARIELA